MPKNLIRPGGHHPGELGVDLPCCVPSPLRILIVSPFCYVWVCWSWLIGTRLGNSDSKENPLNIFMSNCISTRWSSISCGQRCSSPHSLTEQLLQQGDVIQIKAAGDRWRQSSQHSNNNPKLRTSPCIYSLIFSRGFDADFDSSGRPRRWGGSYHPIIS